jgi:epoxyqueuosine reductase
LDTERLRRLAADAGFEIAGNAPAGPVRDFTRYSRWVERGFAGAMGYLADRRAGLREDVRNLAPWAQSVICVGKLYNGPQPYSTDFTDTTRAWVARYAWGDDYHDVVRAGLEQLARAIADITGPFEWKACVDTAPLLERSLARDAGLGWIGKNTCLINQERGSWFFLGELITSLPLESDALPAPDRCGTCTRCIEACPTQAILPAPEGRYEIDSRLCISYLTIELRGEIHPALRALTGKHVFGCDICQDVCPWNRPAPVTREAVFAARWFAPPLDRLAAVTEMEFREMFQSTPVERARYRGFLRNVAVAMGNSGSLALLEPLRRLSKSTDPLVAEHAIWALKKLESEAGDSADPGGACTES